MDDTIVRPVELSTAIAMKIAEIAHHDEVLEKYWYSRWYDQSKRYGEGLRQELEVLQSYLPSPAE